MVVLFNQFNLPENIYEIVFATSQQVEVARLLIEEMKVKGGEIGKTEMSLFATALHDGRNIEVISEGPFRQKKQVKISYNKRQFYDRILTPMKTMGLIDYDLYKKTYKISEKFNKKTLRLCFSSQSELYSIFVKVFSAQLCAVVTVRKVSSILMTLNLHVHRFYKSFGTHAKRFEPPPMFSRTRLCFSTSFSS